jgi:hypothetical protein
MSIADCYDSHFQLFVLTTRFGCEDWKTTLIFLVQAQLAPVAGNSSTAAFSIRKVCMRLITGEKFLSAVASHSSLCVGVSILCGISCTFLTGRTRYTQQ